MNAEAEYRYRNQKADLARDGLAACRRNALETLRVKTVIKESHGLPGTCLVFNHADPSCSNLFATVGGTQATVYDDSHLGEFIDVVVHFDNQATEHSEGGGLQVCAWLDARGVTAHSYGDAWLAVGGTDPAISVMSIVEARVVYQLKGHEKEVVQLAGVPGRPGWLVSLAKSGNIRVWHVPSESCVASYTSDATCLAVHPDGQCLVTGGKGGVLRQWDLPSAKFVGKIPENDKAEPSEEGSSGQEVMMAGAYRHTENIDCASFLSGEQLATKSTDGRVIIWDWTARKGSVTWKIPGCRNDARCLFGATADGALICCGNSDGEVMVYNVSTAERLTSVTPIKVTGAVRACGLSEDCRHLLALIGNGFIFRWQALAAVENAPVDDEIAAEAEDA